MFVTHGNTSVQFVFRVEQAAYVTRGVIICPPPPRAFPRRSFAPLLKQLCYMSGLLGLVSGLGLG